LSGNGSSGRSAKPHKFVDFQEENLEHLFELSADVSLYPKEQENLFMEHFGRWSFIHGLAWQVYEGVNL
jgi:hypothetical protein